MSHPIPDAALDDRLGFVGTSGSGKTYGAGTAVERLLVRRSRVVTVDPLGVWYGLRLAADGKAPSPFEVVIFGGAHGDLPITENAGALIGETVAGMKESAIVDLSQLGTKAAERRFALGFLTALYRKTSGQPVHVVFDEADLWAPQVIRDRDQEPQKLLGMMETIVRRGRIKGFIPWLITQRPAVVNKDVLSQVDGLIAFKLTASQDRKALGDWIEGQADREEGKRILASLPEKQTGQAVVWVPGRGVLATATFPPKATFDSSRAPKRGEKHAAAELRPLDVGALRERLTTVEAEVRASDPKALKAEIARLRSESQKLSDKKSETISRSDIEEAERRGYAQGVTKGFADGFTAATKHFDAAIDRLHDAQGEANDRIADLIRVADKVPALPAPRATLQRPRLINPPKSNGHAAGADHLTGPQRQLLKSLAWWAAMGHEQPTRTQVAAIAGWRPKGSNLRNRLSELSSLGLVDYPAEGRVRLTSAGTAAAPEPDTAVTLIDSIRGMLTGPQGALFEALLEAGTEIRRDELAARIGWEPGGSNLRNRLSELSALEVVEYPSRGGVMLQGWVLQ